MTELHLNHIIDTTHYFNVQDKVQILMKRDNSRKKIDFIRARGVNGHVVSFSSIKTTEDDNR